MFEHFRGNEAFVKRIMDVMDRCERQNRWIITPFLTPLEQEIAQKVIGKQLHTIVDGGHPNAEMKRFAMGPYVCEMDMEIICMKATYEKHERTLSHRDVLGALMHLGLARNQFGDIQVMDTDIYIYIRAEIKTLIEQELTKVARYPLQFHEYEGVIDVQEELIYQTRTISSLRLDCVVAACANISRTKAETLIRGKLVKVNHLPLEDCKCLCNNNSTISIRGFGRFRMICEGKVSKKGRILIEIGKFVG